MALIKCRECGREVSDKAQACPNCGAPIASAGATSPGAGAAAAQAHAPRAQSATGKGFLGCLGLLAVFALIGYLFPSKDSAHTSGPRDLTIMSAIQCRDFVKARLKAPATADFSSLSGSASRFADNKYVVHAYVDAQNSFGANIRNTYVCTVQYTGGDDSDIRSWRLIDLSMTP
jgi:predicted lipid-binding transport protein (Tim44 family)